MIGHRGSGRRPHAPSTLPNGPTALAFWRGPGVSGPPARQMEVKCRCVGHTSAGQVGTQDHLLHDLPSHRQSCIFPAWISPDPRFVFFCHRHGVVRRSQSSSSLFASRSLPLLLTFSFPSASACACLVTVGFFLFFLLFMRSALFPYVVANWKTGEIE